MIAYYNNQYLELLHFTRTATLDLEYELSTTSMW